MALPSIYSASKMAPPTARAGPSREQPWADRAPWGLRNLPRIVGAAGNCAGSQYAARRANLGCINSFGAVALTAWLGDRQCQRQWRPWTLRNKQARVLGGCHLGGGCGGTQRDTERGWAGSPLEHLECGQQPHAQDRGAEKRLQLAGRSGSGYGQESPSPGGARSQGHNTGLRGIVPRSGFPLAAERTLYSELKNTLRGLAPRTRFPLNCKDAPSTRS